VPNIEGLCLEAGNVASSRAGITVNEFLQSPTNPSVHAAGDCCDCGAPQLSFTASATALAVSHNLLNGNSQSVDFSGQASVAFTLPAIARAGMSEEEARASGADLLVKHEDTTRWFTNRRAAEHAGAYKLLIDKKADTILGAHLLAHHCEEFINVFSMAIRHGITREQLRQVLWAHPSSASDLNRMMF
jgi:glutathione reductase (NADPH)